MNLGEIHKKTFSSVCAIVCPVNAITLVERISGHAYVSKTEHDHKKILVDLYGQPKITIIRVKQNNVEIPLLSPRIELENWKGRRKRLGPRLSIDLTIGFLRARPYTLCTRTSVASRPAIVGSLRILIASATNAEAMKPCKNSFQQRLKLARSHLPIGCIALFEFLNFLSENFVEDACEVTDEPATIAAQFSATLQCFFNYF